MSKLAADPYYFNNSKHFNKEEFVEKDVLFLKAFFRKTEAEIYEASKSYIGREAELFNFTSTIKFWRNAIEVQLTDKSTNLSTLVGVFAVEAIVGSQIRGKEERLRNFLINFLDRDEKIELLSGYTFGAPYKTGEGRFRKKHLCHRAVILSDNGRHYNHSYCTSGPAPICACRDWLTQSPLVKINRYLNMFATYFYQMRNAVVHDASFVRFTSMPFFDDEVGNIVPTTVDAYSDNAKKTFTSYDTDVTVHRFHKIMKSAAWRCFSSGTRLSEYKKVPLLKRL